MKHLKILLPPRPPACCHVYPALLQILAGVFFTHSQWSAARLSPVGGAVPSFYHALCLGFIALTTSRSLSLLHFRHFCFLFSLSLFANFSFYFFIFGFMGSVLWERDPLSFSLFFPVSVNEKGLWLLSGFFFVHQALIRFSFSFHFIILFESKISVELLHGCNGSESKGGS